MAPSQAPSAGLFTLSPKLLAIPSIIHKLRLESRPLVAIHTVSPSSLIDILNSELSTLGDVILRIRIKNHNATTRKLRDLGWHEHST